MRTTFGFITALAAVLTLTLPASAQVRLDVPTFPRNDYAAWSPDGKRIAFTSDRLGSLDIFVMNANGTQQRALVRSSGDEWRPAWSPDGKRIAFVSDRESRFSQIYSVDVASGRQDRLTFASASDSWPSWSSDGRIAFSRWTYDHDGDDEGSQIYVMNADGTGLRQVIADDDDDVAPAWSPDSSKIAFVGGDEDGFID